MHVNMGWNLITVQTKAEIISNHQFTTLQAN